MLLLQQHSNRAYLSSWLAICLSTLTTVDRSGTTCATFTLRCISNSALDRLKDCIDRLNDYTYKSDSLSYSTSNYSFNLHDDFEDKAKSFINLPAFCSKTNDFLQTLPDLTVDEGATNLSELLLEILNNCAVKKNAAIFLLTYGSMETAKDKK